MTTYKNQKSVIFFDELGRFKAKESTIFCFALCFLSLMITYSGSILSAKAVKVEVIELTEDQGFYQSEQIRLIYPPDLLQLKEISNSEMVMMTSLTEFGSDEGSIPRIDSMIASSVTFVNDTVVSMDSDTQFDHFEEFACFMIAAYYGDELSQEDYNYLYCGLPLVIDLAQAKFESDSIFGYMDARVDAFGGLPDMRFRILLTGDTDFAVVTVLATHAGISDYADLVFTKVFQSVEYKLN